MLKKEQQKWIRELRSIKFDTPFMLVDTEKIQKNIRLLKSLLPEVDIFYAIKSNSDTKILEITHDLISGYDIASLGEMNILKNMGVGPDKMRFSNPVKIPKHIKQAYEYGVRDFAFDSLDEVKKLAKYAPGANAYLRIRVSDYGSKFPLSGKFGVDPLHAVAYVDVAVEAGLNVNGLAFHVGSQSENPQVWASAFETCGQLIERLARVGVNIEFVNMGGGLPAVYTEKIVSLKQSTNIIKKAIHRHIPEHVRILAEPGRFISADSAVIAATVIAREHRGSSEWLFLDMGVFQGLMEPLEISSWRYPVFTNYGDKAEVFSKQFVLTGPTCDAYDTIGLDYNLPSNISIGDRIYIGAAGAYTLVYKTKFNGFEPPKCYYIGETNSTTKIK